jgi:peptidoglycan/xylan/chitin deacetylase (PgdA/CDA1 family)
MRKTTLFIILCCILALTVACATAEHSPTPSPTQIPTYTSSPTTAASPTPTETSTPTSSPTPHADIAPVLTPVAVHFVMNGSREKPYVALTFDLCQIPAYPTGFEPKIVDVLKHFHAPATFFLGGDWMRTHPDETLLLAGEPLFELGNHSWSHPDFRSLDWREIDQEIVKTQDMLYKLTGRESHLFRLPYGYQSKLALGEIAKHGLYTIQWDVETGDPDPNFDAPTIQRAVREGVQNGSIIIMHANGNGWHTAEALPGVIEYLQQQGYILVTVSQLIGGRQ